MRSLRWVVGADGSTTGDWRRSPSHYATMTDPRFRHVGFGYEGGRSPKYATFWVQHFGAGGSCT